MISQRLMTLIINKQGRRNGGAKGAVPPLLNYWGVLAPLLHDIYIGTQISTGRYSPFYVPHTLSLLLILVFELYP